MEIVQKYAALNKKNCEEHPRSNFAQNSNVHRSQEDYFTQASEDFECRVTNKLSQEFSRAENRILGALSRLGDFLMNPLSQSYSGTAPETSRNAYGSNQGTNEDDSQSDPHPEASIFQSQTTHNSGPEYGHDMVTGVQKKSLCGYDMVIGVHKESLYSHDMVTEVHEEVTYCSPSTTTGKQKNNRSTNQPHLLSENTPATIEANQIFLALQRLAKKQQYCKFS